MCCHRLRECFGGVYDDGGSAVAGGKLSDRCDAERAAERELHGGDESGLGSVADCAGGECDDGATTDTSFVCGIAAVVERERRARRRRECRRARSRFSITEAVVDHRASDEWRGERHLSVAGDRERTRWWRAMAVTETSWRAHRRRRRRRCQAMPDFSLASSGIDDADGGRGRCCELRR